MLLQPVTSSVGDLRYTAVCYAVQKVTGKGKVGRITKHSLTLNVVVFRDGIIFCVGVFLELLFLFLFLKKKFQNFKKAFKF
jgi:hypothetical protein